jgi:UDP-glucose 4-epimerase
VLRPTNVIGPEIHNTMSNFLRNRRVPYLAGFNPMTQFLHEDDLAEAIVTATESSTPGIFNLAGQTAVPWRTALDLCEALSFPLPPLLVSLYMSAFSGLPQYLVNFFKYPCVISDRAFRGAFAWEPRISIRETLWSTVAAARALQQKGSNQSNQQG